MHIFGEIPFVKLQNNTETTDKRLETMKNSRYLKKIVSLSRFPSFVTVYLLFKCRFAA